MSAEESEAAAYLRGAGVPEEFLQRLARYSALVLEANRRFNLTGAASPAAFAAHVVDSLTVIPYLCEPWIDVGSGAGLPGLPAALVRGIAATLVDSTAKKAAFLQSAAEALGVEIIARAGRAEVLGHLPDLREGFGSVTARAVASAPAVLELTVPFLRIGGLAILQRGKLEQREREATADAALLLGCRLEDEIRLDGERRILLVRKEAATPRRYPRRAGIPEKRPLCFYVSRET